jgi:hypothetical protein
MDTTLHLLLSQTHFDLGDDASQVFRILELLGLAEKRFVVIPIKENGEDQEVQDDDEELRSDMRLTFFATENLVRLMNKNGIKSPEMI